MREPIVNIAVNAARAAGNIIIRGFDQRDRIKISQKQPNDYVTEIDQAAEREIIQIIRKAHPNHGILGEEGGEILGNEFIWIIDPLDGTRNFIHGYPHFCVSIGITYKGKLEHGVIYDPIRQELFTATRGKGARLNEHRIRVSKHTQLQECLLGTGFPYRHSEQHIAAYIESFKEVMPICGDIRRGGSAALDLAYVACGRLDGYWELGLKKWDMAAGALLVKEAGGMVTNIDGTDDFFTNGNIMAANPKVLKLILKHIKPHFDVLSPD